MSQNSNTTSSSDSNVLYSLNTNYDYSGSDGSNLSAYGSGSNDDNDVHYEMESDSEEKTDYDDDQVDLNSEEINMDVVTDNHQNIQWSKKTKFEPDLPVFGEKFMLKDDIDLPKSPSPYDFFNLFLTSDIVDYIVQQSNLYCTQQNFKQEPMNNLDLYHLIGFLFYSSLCKLPCKSDYWTSTCGSEIVMKNITRNRIDQLLRSLHFGNNILQNQSSDKIQPLIDLFNNRCGSVVKQEQNISIDEQMIGYKGKSAPKSYKQYMPKKPTKRGFKLWSLSGVSGYTYRIKLYQGANANMPVAQMKLSSYTTASSELQTRSKHRNDEDNEKLAKQSEDIKRYGQSGMVVIDLLDDIPKGSHIFTDNYFASLSLLHEMTSLGYGLTCTLRSNRIKNCPIKSEKAMSKYPRGYYDYLVSKDKKIMIVAWQDKKRVLMGSNFIGIEPLTQLSRWDKQNRQKMDIANIMLREPRAIERRMLKVLVTNQSSSESDDDDNLVRQKRKRETASNISSMVRFDGLEHWPQYQQSLRLRCKNKGCSMKTNVYCSKCQVHLCFCTTRNCFKDYHCKN
ncbi:unnamed protein product [Rotaria sordida]|uniref:PiggyBac transposable element-derived protein domain-containing protein n=1 Tax=Rotaria sordida TaxID=392033 RepID=A0A819VR04_9BILA|nr:unnamed protein product [Rotaria sordida]CAF4113679.1 unnamed protein product [Rotaria sordida]